MYLKNRGVGRGAEKTRRWGRGCRAGPAPTRTKGTIALPPQSHESPTVADLRTPCYQNGRSWPFSGSDRILGPRLRRLLLQPRRPDLHLNRVPANTEAISNPSELSACANFPLFLHASPLLRISARNGAYGFTFYVRAPQLAFHTLSTLTKPPALERALEGLPGLPITMSRQCLCASSEEKTFQRVGREEL